MANAYAKYLHLWRAGKAAQAASVAALTIYDCMHAPESAECFWWINGVINARMPTGHEPTVSEVSRYTRRIKLAHVQTL
jgi:hypothetical protein